MKNFIFILFISIHFNSTFAQSSWILSDTLNHFELSKDITQDNNGNIICVSVGIHNIDEENWFSTIDQIDNQGEIRNSYVMEEENDVRPYFLYINSINTNYLVSGYKLDVLNQKSSFSTWLFDENLELIETHEYEVKDEIWGITELPLEDNQFLIVVNTVKWGSLEITDYNNYYFFKLDKNGELLDSVEHHTDYRFQQIYTIEKNINEPGYIGIGAGFRYTIYDENYEYIDNKSHNLKLHGSNNTGWIKQFTDSSYIYGGTLKVPGTQYRNMGLVIKDKTFNTIESKIFGKYTWGLSGHFQCIDWVDKFSIFFGGKGSESELDNGYEKNLILVNLNEQLEEQWTMYYGGDVPYILLGVFATSDGGCIMQTARNKIDNKYSTIRQKYIIKVGSDGILATNDEETLSPNWSITSYPNPSTGLININLSGQVHDATITIYNQTGIPIGHHHKIAQGMNSFDFSDIPSGMYFISISKDGKRLGQQQWVKQ